MKCKFNQLCSPLLVNRLIMPPSIRKIELAWMSGCVVFGVVGVKSHMLMLKCLILMLLLIVLELSIAATRMQRSKLMRLEFVKWSMVHLIFSATGGMADQAIVFL